MMVEAKKTIEIFYSYAHKDEKWRKELEKQLSNLRHQGLITSWYDRNISAGTEWAREIDTHLNTASIILLLVSPDFIASDYCYSIEMKRAMERHEAGEARVIPIIVRPTEWEETAFGKLQVLPTTSRPISNWKNRDDAFLDIVKGIGKAVREIVKDTFDEQVTILQQRYCEILHERWKMLDFKGIMHVDMNRPISIPLTEVFILPDVLVGIPEYETIERENVYEDNDNHDEESEKLWEDEQEQLVNRHRSLGLLEKQITLQREELHSVLAKNRRLVILGDPGSGKSTLLRYLLLQLAQRDNDLTRIFPQMSDAFPLIPLYIPLASYAEVWLSNTPGDRSLKDFLPKYLRENYLDTYADFLQGQLQHGAVFLLLDGLDEIPDPSLRIQIVRHIEAFTQSYPGNRFIVTSRIVGYKEAPLAADYQAFTLADFSEDQIKTFVEKWCPAYERWVKGTTDSQYLEDLAKKETKKLFDATQRKPGVKRLAVNPLLLTILALIQRQGIELPSHSIELFDLCATTLLDTWVKAKGQAGSPPFSKNDLIKILRPLAFWMHQHQAVGAIPEEELTEQITRQLLERKITRYEDEATKLAERFLYTVRGKMGILIERGRQRYGFLHQTFEEYFAARELEIRKDRNDFIKLHLHDSRWREIILLTVGAIGILQSNEEGVTELIEETILKANSPFETWLHRDLLFAGLCLADDIGVSVSCEDEISEQMLYFYITTPYDSILNAFMSVLTQWSDTPAGIKIAKVALSILRERNRLIGTTTQSLTSSSDTALFERLSTHYQHLVQQYQEALIRLLRLRIISLLGHLETDTTKWVEYALAMLSDSYPDVRQTAALALGHLGSDGPQVIDALLKLLSDTDWQPRVGATTALMRLGNGKPQVIDALLTLFSDPDWHVREAAAEGFGQLVSGQPGAGAAEKLKPQVSKALLTLLSDFDWRVRRAAAEALGQLGSRNDQIFDALLNLLSDSNVSVKEAVAEGLGKLGSGEPQVIDALLQLLSDPSPNVRQAAVGALGQLGSGQPQIIDALLQLLSDPEWLVRQIAVVALGQLGSGQPYIFDALLKLLSDTSANVRAGAIAVLSQLGRGQPQVIDTLLKLVSRLSPRVRQAAAGALGQLGSDQYQVIDALLQLLSDPEWRVKQAAAEALGHLGNQHPQVADALLQLLLDPNWQVRQAVAGALSNIGSRHSQVIDALLQLLSDPEWRVKQAAAEALGHLGNQHPQVTDALLQLLSDPNWQVIEAAAEALGQLSSSQPRAIDALLRLLSDPNRQVKEAVVRALNQLGSEQSSVTAALLQLLSDFDMKELAAMALVQLNGGQPSVINALLQLLLDPAWQTREVATKALKRLGSGKPHVIQYLADILSVTPSADLLKQTGISQKIDEYKQSLDKSLVVRQLRLLKQVHIRHPFFITPLLRLLSDSDWRVREAAAEVLSRLSSEQTEVIDSLLRLLSDPEWQVRQAAAGALGQLGSVQPEVIDSLLRLLSDPRSHVRLTVAGAIRQLGSGQPHVVDALLEILSRSSPSARQAAVEALGQMGETEPQVIEALLRLLSDPSPNVRQAVAGALGHLGSDQYQVIEALLRLLSDPDWRVNEVAAGALGRLNSGQPQVIEALLQLISISNRHLKTAIAVLGRMGPGRPEVIEALLQLLLHSNPYARQAAAEALGQLDNGQPQVIEALLRLLSDPNPYVRQAAAEALGHLDSGQPQVIESLLKLLVDFDWQPRVGATVALKQLGRWSNQVVEILLPLHSDPHPFVRQAAAGALGHLDSGQPQVIESLLKLLFDADRRVRQAAASALLILSVEGVTVGFYIEKLLRQYEPVTNGQFIPGGIMDTLLFTLQRVVE